MLFWWLGIWPHAQLAAAGAGFGVFVFFGLFLLLLWVPNYDQKDDVATDRIKTGWAFILIGFLLGIFGLFLFLLMCAALTVFLIWVVVRSIGIVTKRT